MYYKIAKNEKDFHSLKEHWSQLISSAEFSVVFKSFDWNFQWWKRYYRKTHTPFIISMYHDKTLSDPLAIFPLMLSTKGDLTLIADIHSDYDGCLLKNRSLSMLEKIFKQFAKILDEHSEVRSLELKNLSMKENLYALLFIQFDHRQILFQSNAYSYRKFSPSALRDCFAFFPSKKWQKIKQLYKKYEHISEEIYDIESIPFPANEIKNLTKNMIERGVRDKYFLDENLLQTIKELYESDSLRIHVLLQNHKIVALNFFFHEQKNNHYLFWIDLYLDLPQINIVSYLFFIKHLCKNAEQSFTIDFGRGLYPYKMHNFEPEIDNLYTFYYAKNDLLYGWYLLKLFLKFALKPFYKRHKKLINRILHR